MSRAPAFDANTIEGQITALRSPAVNVRAIGFNGLKARGAAAVGAVAALLNDPNRFIRARALYLLYQLGPEGQKRAGSPESQTDPAMRIAAYRAMRRAGLDVLPVAAKLAKDTDPGVRREVALSLRDQPAEKSLDLLVELARGYDGQDRTYLEALGTGATKKEAALYDRLRTEPGAKNDPLAWSPTFTRLAWRLHVPAAVPDLLARARVGEAVRGRSHAGDGHAGVHRRSGGIEGDADARRAGQRAEGAGHVVAAEPDVEQLVGARPAAGAEDGRHLRSRRDRAARGDHPAAGREPAGAVGRRDRCSSRATPRAARKRSTRCAMCHPIGGVGAEVGPALDGWGRGKSADVIATAIVNPSAEIAHGYDGWELRTNEGLTIQGVLIKQGDPLMMRSMGGVTQIIPLNRVGSRRRVQGSLMMSAAQLGLTEQDVADLVAFLSRIPEPQTTGRPPPDPNRR